MNCVQNYKIGFLLKFRKLVDRLAPSSPKLGRLIILIAIRLHYKQNFSSFLLYKLNWHQSIKNISIVHQNQSIKKRKLSPNAKNNSENGQNYLQTLRLQTLPKLQMSTQIQSTQSYSMTINSSFLSQYPSEKPIYQKRRSKFTINPRLSILPSSIDPQKSKLEIYKQHLLNIRLRKQAIPQVPEPSIISCFNMLKEQKSLTAKKQKLKKELQNKKHQYEKLKKTIDKYREIYESKEESIKEKILLSKILSTKLQAQFQKTKEKFKQLQFSKIMNLAQKKQYFYQLAQIFFNQKARNIFSFQKQLSRTDQQMGICLGYLAFLIQKACKIAGIQMWIKLKFKGYRSTISICDAKIIQAFSNTSSQQNNNLVILQHVFLLHPKQQRMTQALNCLSQQLKQLMRYGLGINVGKSNNFYQLCEELSKFLLNV